MFEAAQAELDEDRQESDRLISELATENEQLRSVLKIRDEFHIPDMTAYISEALKRAETSLASMTQVATN